MDVEQIAQVCHEANRRLCVTQGDTSHMSWEATPWSGKQSAIAGVVFLQNNPDASLSALHESWRKRKMEEGWRHGAERDDLVKTHPASLPYEELPPQQQVKDRLFRAIVIALSQGENNV